MDVDEKALGKQYEEWIKEALRQGHLRRNAVWSSELAVGDDGFIEQIKKNVGRWISKMAVNEELAQYGQHVDMAENSLEWSIFDEKNL